jgi:hypothetical protein
LALNTYRMKIICRTLFDCSHTGVTGTFRSGAVPFVDRAGQKVDNIDSWNRSRNQQRNYETLLQIFGLRTQPQDIVGPNRKNKTWEISFVSEVEAVFEILGNADRLILLKQDCEGVPMMLNLLENKKIQPVLCTSGRDQNIWFELINNTLE